MDASVDADVDIGEGRKGSLKGREGGAGSGRVDADDEAEWVCESERECVVVLLFGRVGFW